jgi:uncharacterized OB-fold protein
MPVASGETRPFWDACQRGVFLIQKCRDCHKFQYHYRGFCCHCWSPDVDDYPIEGHGTVWTFTVVERNNSPGFKELTPYVVALVELPEGVRVLTNIVHCNPDSVAIGQRVRLTFVDAAEGFRIPMFEPA